MTTPFIIYALPRSRTLWLSKFLTYGQWECKHDLYAEYPSVVKVAEYLKTPYRGVSETGLVCHHKPMRDLVPEAKIVCIHRNPGQVKDSLAHIGLAGRIDVDYIYERLEELNRVKGVLHIDYDWLDEMAVCAKISTFCTGQFDPAWYACLRNANIQVDTSLGPPHAQF